MGEEGSSRVFGMFYWGNVVALVLQVLGLIGNPVVLFLYVVEQVEIFVLGSSPRASDMRIVMSFVANVALIQTVHMTIVPGSSNRIRALAGVAFLASHNLWFSCGMKKPFKVVKEQS